MSTTYEYYVDGIVDIPGKVTEIDGILTGDPELGSTYTSTTFNAGTGKIEVVFSSALATLLEQVLNNIVNDVFFSTTNKFINFTGPVRRKSYGVTFEPDADNDTTETYNIGSIVSTTDDKVFFCTENTAGSAVWTRLDGVTGPTGSQGPAGESGGSTGQVFSGSDGTGGINIDAGWTDIPLNIEHKKTSNMTHAASSAEVTVNQTGTYVITGYISTTSVSGTNSSAEGRLMRDTGGGYAELVGACVNMSSDTALNDDRNTGSFSIVIDITSGDKFKLQAQRAVGTANIETIPCSGLAIYTVSSIGDQGDIGPTGPNANFERQVTVAQSGGDFTTLAAALTAITGGSITGGVPTAANPVLLTVYPGTYSEANPITVPSFVTIAAASSERSGSENTVQITPATSTTTSIFTLSSSSNVTGILAKGATGTGGIGFLAPAGTFNVQLQSCIVEACEIGYSIVGDGVAAFSTVIFAQNCFARGTATTTLTTGFSATAGGFLGGAVLSSFGNPLGTAIGTGFLASGSFSSMGMGTVQAQLCDKGFVSTSGVADEEPLIRLTGGEIVSCITAGIEIGANSTIEMYGVSVSGSIANDIVLTAATSKFLGAGNKIRNDLVSNTSNGAFIGSSLSDQPGENAIAIRGELHVGTVNEPAESAFGGGDSHTQGMTVFTFNGVATFVDITADVKLSGDGLTAAAFAGTGVGNILYVGGDLDKFPNIKTLMTTAVVPAGAAGLITCEYWSGASWSTVNIMSTDGDAPYAPHAKELFDLGSFQYRFGSLTGWATTTVNSVTAYWMRFRISAAGMTTIPILDQIKLGTNRVEINKDGFIEYFGTSETSVRLPFDVNWFRPSNNSPANQDLFLQDTISVGRQENNFQTGVLDRSGFLTELPEEIDTSRVITLRFRYRVSSAVAGDVDLTLRWGYNLDYDDDPTPVGTSLSSVFPDTGTAPASAPGLLGTTNNVLSIPASRENRVLTIDFNVDISTLVACRATGSGTGDILWVSFQRDGTSGSDTYVGSFSLIQVTPFYTKWSEGASTLR